MKLGIMQPYFFPYLGYFSLIANTDHFIFFDTPQYERRSWMNRNRILNANGEPAYISVPVHKVPQQTAIKDIKIDYSNDWAASMIARMVHYKKYAPHYSEISELFQNLLSKKDDSLSKLNIETTVAVCRYLGITTSFETFSEMNLEIDEVHAPDEWALEITKAMDYDTYVNPPGGADFFDNEKYIKAGIELQFLKNNLPTYVQRIGKFVPGLSIIDVLMFNSINEIREMLDDNTIIKK